MRRFTLKTVALALLGLFGAQGVCVQAQTWTGSTPSDANSKTVYLYNVGAGKFLGKGGRWGTEANINYEGVPFKLTYTSTARTFTLQSLVMAEASTTTNGYLTICDGVNSEHDKGNYFVDRNDVANNAFTATATESDNKVYFLTIKPDFVFVKDNKKSDMFGKIFYMVGLEDNTIGSAESTSNAYGQWMIVTEEERRNAFTSAEAANADPVNATFLMYDFDFARNDNSISYWMTGSGASTALTYYSSSLRLPSYAQGGKVKKYTHTYTSTHDAAYKSGTTTTTSKTSHANVSFTLTSLVPGDEMPDTIIAYCGGDDYTEKKTTYKHTSEEVAFILTSTTSTESTVDAYTYYVGNGYTEADGTNTIKYTTKDGDSKSVTYKFDGITGQEHDGEENRQAAFGGNWTANIHGASGAVQQTLENSNMVRKGYYRISCKAFTTATQGTVRLWAGSGEYSTDAESEKYAYTAIPTIDEAPETYVAASRTLETGGQTYDASVKVYVENVSDLLKFGIYVDGAEETAWTCFDDFAIEYLGDPTTVLVLDEDQTNGKYINNQATKDGDELKTVKLYLHRSLNVGKWNSLVLPVDLTVGQVKSAFGDQVRISALEGATDETRPQTIIFKAITADRNNNNETAIKAGQLYLVKPTKAMPTSQTAVEFEVPGQTEKATITSYYTIVGVTYAHAADVKDTDYSKKVTGTQGDETYGSETKVKFCGTYVKLSDDNKIPVNSYVLNGNNEGGTAGVWYYRTVTTASKGFRGWLETIEGETSTGIQYELDGVVEKVSGDATGIGDIVVNPNAISGNIYNLNGQLVRRNATSLEGLASGIYVAGGKKYVVK